MSWPKAPDYNEAVQNPHISLADDELRAGEVARSPLGLPLLWAGNFADVYKIHCPATGNTWALKCFTREVRGLRERYRSIAAHLEQARLPFTVDFQYLEQGIRIGGAWFPVLKMRWIEGLTLNQFVEEHLKRPKNLGMLLDLWVKLAARLREAQVAHADLQHGNVLLVPMPGGQLALRLIDYDGMWVPALAGTRSGEVGHPAYQHPQRLREGTYNAEVDRFSHLAIYTAIRCLMLGKGDLWRQFNNGDNLLFRESDFRQPGASDVFRALWKLRDANARALAGRLILATQLPLERVPLVDEVVSDGSIHPLSREEGQQVRGVLDGAPASPQTAQAVGGKPGTVPWWTSGQTTGTVAPPAPSVPPSVPTPAEALPPTPAEAVSPATAAEPVVSPSRMTAALRWPLRASLQAVRRVDRLLGILVGPENTILHNFLRAAVAACTVLVLALSIGIAILHFKAQREATRTQNEAIGAHHEATARAKEEAGGSEHQELAGKAKQEEGAKAWSAAWVAADKDLLEEYASERFDAAVEKAALAQRQALAGKVEEAAATYADALATLNGTIARALDARSRNEAAPPQKLRTFGGPKQSAHCVAFSPDGRQVLTGCQGMAILWDAATGQQIRTLQGHTHYRFVNSVAFSSDGRQVLTGSDDKTAILWDAATGQKLRTFQGHTDRVLSVAFSPDSRQVLTGSSDKTTILWDAATGQKLCTFQGYTQGGWSVPFSPDGRQVVTGSHDKTAVVWDAVTGQDLRTFKGHRDDVTCVAFSPDGRQVLTGSHDGTAILWDAVTGQRVREFKEHRGTSVTFVAFSSDGRQVLIKPNRRGILYDAATGQRLRTIEDGSNCDSIAFSPDGRQVCTTSYNGTAVLWDVSGLSGGESVGESTPLEPKPRPD